MDGNWLAGLVLPPGFPSWIIPAFVLVLGAVVGSFLNVCIHRMPRGDSIVKPRSHCYSCGVTIRWFDNIPLLSYLLLGGKCRDCGARFSPRYGLVELLTAILFLTIWNCFDPFLAFAYMVFAGGLIVGTFIDFEHYIIPDEITLGGIVVGVLLSGLIPELQGEELHARGALWSLAGAAVGYGILWIVVELGKRLFGVAKKELPHPMEVFITPKSIRIGEETDLWEDLLLRPTDTLSFGAMGVRRGGQQWDQAKIRVRHDEVHVDDEVFKLEEIGELMAVAKTFYVPREAMGFGDVKFLGAIGAFLGAKAIFFVILASSLIGSVVGILTMVLGRRGWGLKLPYGPYLALAAFIWIFWGSGWAVRYFEWLAR